MLTETFDFSNALTLLKKGYSMARLGWNNPIIKVFAEFPDEYSANNLAYLVMQKGEKTDEFYKRFPLDLSAESIFAEDWFIVAAPVV